MKASELRIGNLLESKKITKHDKVCQVSGILSDECMIKYSYQNMHRQPDINEVMDKLTDLVPIPLTEGWLVKCGFDNDIKENLYSNGDLSMIFPGDVFFINDFETETSYGVGNIKYVHQLQNLYFALTGEELAINPLTTLDSITD